MKRLIIILCTAMFGLAACSPAVQTRKIGEKDNSSNLEIKTGDTLEITLPGNPSTGYVWEAAKIDGKILKQIGEAEYKAETNLVGAPGTETLRFNALSTGKTTLELAYHRPWEKDVPPEKVFSVEINVK